MRPPSKLLRVVACIALTGVCFWALSAPAWAASERAQADWPVSPSLSSRAVVVAVSSPANGRAFVVTVTKGVVALQSVPSHARPTIVVRWRVAEKALAGQAISASVDSFGNAVIARSLGTARRPSGIIRAAYHLAGQSSWSAEENLTHRQAGSNGDLGIALATLVTPDGHPVVAASTATSMVISVLVSDGTWASREIFAPHTPAPVIALDSLGTTIAVGGRDQSTIAFVTALQIDAATGMPAPQGSYLELDRHSAFYSADFGLEPEPGGFVATWERSTTARSVQYAVDDIVLAPQLNAGAIHVVHSIAIPATNSTSGGYSQQTALDGAGNIYLLMYSPFGGAGKGRMWIAVHHGGTWSTRALSSAYYGLRLGASLGSGMLVTFTTGFATVSSAELQDLFRTCARRAASLPAKCRSQVEAAKLTASGRLVGVSPVFSTRVLPRGFVLSVRASTTSPQGERVVAIYGNGWASTATGGGITGKDELVLAFEG